MLAQERYALFKERDSFPRGEQRMADLARQGSTAVVQTRDSLSVEIATARQRAETEEARLADESS